MDTDIGYRHLDRHRRQGCRLLDSHHRLDRHRRLGRHHRQDCRILFFFQGQPKPSTLAIQLLHAHVTSDRHFPGSFASGHPQRAPQGSRTQEHTPGKFTLPEFGVI